MADVVITRGTTLPNSSSKTDFHNLVDQATGTVSNIVNADISASAAIASSKLDFSSVSQTITMNSKAINEAEGASVASASTTNIWVSDGNTIHITGTTTITSLSTASQAGAIRRTIFDGVLTLTNGANLILPGGANITTAAGDCAFWYADTTTQIRCISYLKADGTSVVATTPSVATQAEMETATDITKMVTPGRTQFHPGVAKAWGNFNGSGTPAFNSSHNFDSSITDNGNGDYTLSFTTDFSSANFAVVTTAKLVSTNALVVGTAQSYATGTINLRYINQGDVAVDVNPASIVVFGDQS